MASNGSSSGTLCGHYVICNWNDLGDEIIRQLHASVVREKKPVVIVTDQPEQVLPRQLQADARREGAGGPEDDPYHGVFVVPGDPTSDHVLARADVKHAETAIVLSDPREGDFADTKSVLIALAVEAIEPRVHTIVELLNSRNRIHFKHTLVDEIVCMDELTEKLLAQAALTHGLSEFYMRLLTATDDTNEVYVVDVPEEFVEKGCTYRAVEKAICEYEREDLVLVGVQTDAERMNGDRQLTNRHGQHIRQKVLTVNPPSRATLARRADLQRRNLTDREYVLQKGDKLFVIAYKPPDLADLAPGGG